MIHTPTHAAITTKTKRVLLRNSDLAYMARTRLNGMCQLLALYMDNFLQDNERIRQIFRSDILFRHTPAGCLTNWPFSIC